MKKNRYMSSQNSEQIPKNFYDPMTLEEAYDGAKNMVIGLREESLSEDLLQRIDIERIKVEAERQNQLKKM